MGTDLGVIFALIITLLGVWIGQLLSKRKSKQDLIIRDEEIKNAVKGELNPMDISQLVDRANKRWGNREDN